MRTEASIQRAKRRRNQPEVLENETEIEFSQVNQATVTQVLPDLTLPSQLQQRLDSVDRVGSTAYAIARAPDDATRQHLASKALNRELVGTRPILQSSAAASCRSVVHQATSAGRN